MTATMGKRGSTMNSDLRSPALNWINGEWVDSAQHTESINPATGEVIAIKSIGFVDIASQKYCVLKLSLLYILKLFLFMQSVSQEFKL